jgi:alkylhydroperoxidase family enzyme
MARLAYSDQTDVAEVMRRFPPPLEHMNIGRMVSHAPTLVAPYYNTYAAALRRLELDPKLRQLAILRVAERASAEYVLVQHRALAKLAGLTDQQISAARPRGLDSASCWSDSSCCSHAQRLVLAFADQVTAGPRISNSLFEQIHSVLTPREIVELLLVIGWYWTACRLTTTLEIEPEHALGHGVINMLQTEHANHARNGDRCRLRRHPGLLRGGCK